MLKRQVALFSAAVSLCLLVGSAFQVVAPAAPGVSWAAGVLGLFIGCTLVILDRKRRLDFRILNPSPPRHSVAPVRNVTTTLR